MLPLARAELKKQLLMVVPLIVANGLQLLLQVISIIFIGHLDDELALSGASVATSFAGVTAFSLLVGMAEALDTLCGQAFGARQYHLLGIQMQRGIFVLTLACIPLALIWTFTGQILVLLHQDKEISKEAGLYAQWMLPALFGYAIVQCETRFLQSQNLVLPLMLCSGFTGILHMLFCWLFIFKTGLESKGAALASSLSCWVNVLLLGLYIKLSPACSTTWTGFSKEAFYHVPQFIRFAVPSAVMVCLKFWSFELLVLLSGLLPNPKLQASIMSISLNISAVVYTIIAGLGAVISMRVSNELGAANPGAARLSIWVGVFLSTIEVLVMAIIMILLRHTLVHAYINEAVVVNHVAAIMPLLALVHLVNGLECILAGVVRGCGWQKISAYVALGSYYIAGIPSSVVFAFVLHFQTKGLWIGIVIALVVQDLLLAVITLCTDWAKEVEKATNRVQDTSLPVTSL